MLQNTISALIPNEVRKKGAISSFSYYGKSMQPTFKPSSLLFVHRVTCVAVGDVLVFYDEYNDKHVVHRVVKLVTGGFVTKGDNNLLNDPKLLTDDRIVGRVEFWEYNKKIRAVRNGHYAIVSALCLNTLWRIKNLCLKFLQLPYKALRSSGVFRYFFASWIDTRLTIVQIETLEGQSIKVLLGSNVIAWKVASSLQAQYKKPYDLLLPKWKDMEKKQG